MSEKSVVEQTSAPRTRESLAADLRLLSVTPGMTLLTHSSLSALGWVNGGPVAVIQALMDVLTPTGTLVMPAHSDDYSDPAEWRNPPVPETWQQLIRETMPVFDPRLTPTRGMGRIAELFRTWPQVWRSYHPQGSFAAWGQHAEFVTGGHGLEDQFGERSPLARVYDLHGYVLLLGVGYDSNTSFHLAEYRAPGAAVVYNAAPIETDGRRLWHTYKDIAYDDEVFPDIGLAFEQTHPVAIGCVGSAECRLFAQREAVDFAQQWLAARRGIG